MARDSKGWMWQGIEDEDELAATAQANAKWVAQGAIKNACDGS